MKKLVLITVVAELYIQNVKTLESAVLALSDTRAQFHVRKKGSIQGHSGKKYKENSLAITLAKYKSRENKWPSTSLITKSGIKKVASVFKKKIKGVKEVVIFVNVYGDSSQGGWSASGKVMESLRKQIGPFGVRLTYFSDGIS